MTFRASAVRFVSCGTLLSVECVGLGEPSWWVASLMADRFEKAFEKLNEAQRTRFPVGPPMEPTIAATQCLSTSDASKPMGFEAHRFRDTFTCSARHESALKGDHPVKVSECMLSAITVVRSYDTGRKQLLEACATSKQIRI